MKITDIPRIPSYYDKYIDQVADLDLSDALEQSLAVIDALDMEKLQALGDRVYAPGKWTTREVFQHISDCERVFAYRALRIGRGDPTELPSFDEGIFAENAGAKHRSLETVLEELRGVRKSTLQLFNTFDDSALSRTGITSKTQVSALSIGFTLIGHQNHHIRILEERYFPLL